MLVIWFHGHYELIYCTRLKSSHRIWPLLGYHIFQNGVGSLSLLLLSKYRIVGHYSAMSIWDWLQKNEQLLLVSTCYANHAGVSRFSEA